jgi:NADH dehydrogenase [ubiquinone] 1 alpha subcomplex assembly factor 6
VFIVSPSFPLVGGNVAHSPTLSYCAEEVRRSDRDRFIMTLFAPSERREALFALYAFNIEISKTREVVSEAMLGAIRLQWWRDSVDTLYSDVPLRKHTVMEALDPFVTAHQLSRDHFDRLIDGRLIDLEEVPHPTSASLIEYADATSGALVRLSMEVLGGTKSGAAIEVAHKVGVAWALGGIVRALPSLLKRGRVVLPEELLARHQVDRRSMLNLRPSEELNLAIKELVATAREHLQDARELRREIPRSLVPAFLPAVLVDSYLNRLERAGYNVFDERIRAPVGLATARLAYRATIGRY